MFPLLLGLDPEHRPGCAYLPDVVRSLPGFAMQEDHNRILVRGIVITGNEQSVAQYLTGRAGEGPVLEVTNRYAVGRARHQHGKNHDATSLVVEHSVSPLSVTP